MLFKTNIPNDNKFRTIHSLLEHRSKTHADEPFISFKKIDDADGIIITFGEMHNTTNQIAHGFLENGVEINDKVCVMLRNSVEMLYCWFALSKIGVIYVPINYEFKGKGLAHIINTTEAELLITDDFGFGNFVKIQSDLNHIKKIIIVGNKPIINNIKNFEILPFSKLISGNCTPIQEDIDHTDITMFMFTSGTTGPSKAIMISHNYAFTFAEEIIQAFELSKKDVLYCPYPLFHASASLLITLPGLILGTKVALSDRFSVSNFWDEIKYHGATFLEFMGATLKILFNQPEKINDPDNTVRLAWTVPVPDIWHDFEKRFNLKLGTGYGLTDAGMVIYNPINKKLEPGLCGKPTDTYDVRIFNNDDEELPPCEIGEIVVRPRKPFTIMGGYYNNPEATLDTFRNLWFHTGDLGYKDKEGYFYFSGRKKDSIRRRGENISTWEIETEIVTHPLITECAAVGVPSKLTEEDVEVFIVLKTGSNLTPEEIIEYCKERMSRSMVPRYIEIVNSLPKTQTGKIEKYKLSEISITNNTWDREKNTLNTF